jgi:hypothetical protein
MKIFILYFSFFFQLIKSREKVENVGPLKLELYNGDGKDIDWD